MILTAEQGEGEIKVTPLTRQIRFSNFGPGDLEVSIDQLVVLIKKDASRILRTDKVTEIFLRTKTQCQYEIKEFK